MESMKEPEIERRAWRVVGIALSCSVALAGCGDNVTTCDITPLDGTYLWYGDNRAVLEDFMQEHGRCAAPERAPIAVFDWDNTVIWGDIGDGTMFHLLLNDAVRRPDSWAATSAHLTAEALESLDTHCPLASLPDPLPTSTDLACTTAILCIYLEETVWSGEAIEADAGTLCTGAAAWNMTGDATPDTIQPAYAWAVSFQAGHTPAELGALARAAFDTRLAAPIGATTTLGYMTGLAGSIRIYDQIRDLITTLDENGFEVWISSATSEAVIDAIAPLAVGVTAARAIGVRSLLDDEGRITHGFMGCGTFPDGTQDIINYRQGKRCWINKVVFGIAEDEQLDAPSPIAFGAGDADTDVFFLDDASGLRLALNRNKHEIMCKAYANQDGRWLVNPLFIRPLPRRDAGYDCGAFGLPDQDDSAFCDDRAYDGENCSMPLW